MTEPADGDKAVTRGNGELAGVGGLRLFRQHWFPDTDPSAIVVLVHGFGEHSDRYHQVAVRLVGAGCAVHAIDHRGHGRSQGPRALIDRAAHAVTDINALVSAAIAEHGPRRLPVLMVGHSMGAMLAVRYALSHQHRLAGLALSGALASLDTPRPLVAVGRLLSAVAPRAPTVRVDPALVSRDPAVVAAYRADPLVHHGRIPARTAGEIAATVGSFPARAHELTIPTLIMYGTADRVCPPAGSVMLSERIGADDKTIIPYDGLYHEIFNEPERETVLSDLTAWLAARTAAPAATV